MAKITRIKATDPKASEEKPKKTTAKKVASKKSTGKKVADKKAVIKKVASKKAVVEKPAGKKFEMKEGNKPAKSGKKTFILFRPFKALFGYIHDAWKEIRQVRWPSRKATWKMALAVLVYTALFVVLITLLDMFFSWLFGNIIK